MMQREERHVGGSTALCSKPWVLEVESLLLDGLGLAYGL
jgi:hypothetical protein